MNCPFCKCDLGAEETIIALVAGAKFGDYEVVQPGTLMCHACFGKHFSLCVGEEVVPSDIGITIGGVTNDGCKKVSK